MEHMDKLAKLIKEGCIACKSRVAPSLLVPPPLANDPIISEMHVVIVEDQIHLQELSHPLAPTPLPMLKPLLPLSATGPSQRGLPPPLASQPAVKQP